MKIEIEQNCTGTGEFKWNLATGPDGIDEYFGTADTLGECFEQIVMWRTLNSQSYREAE